MIENKIRGIHTYRQESHNEGRIGGLTGDKSWGEDEWKILAAFFD